MMRIYLGQNPKSGWENFWDKKLEMNIMFLHYLFIIFCNHIMSYDNKIF